MSTMRGRKGHGKVPKSFTDEEHAHIWQFVAQEYKRKNFLALQRYGDLIWEKYIQLGHSHRTLISLRTHFGRYMYPRMYMADLPKEDLFGLLKYFRVTLGDDHVKYLEEKFQCEVKRNSLGIIIVEGELDHRFHVGKRYSDGTRTEPVGAPPVAPYGRRSEQLVPAQASSSPLGRLSEGASLAAKKPRIKQEVLELDSGIGEATMGPVQNACLSSFGSRNADVVRTRALTVLSGQASVETLYDSIPEGVRRRHGELATLLKSLLTDCANVPPQPKPLPATASRPGTVNSEAHLTLPVTRPDLSMMKPPGVSKSSKIAWLQQQIADIKNDIERYDAKIKSTKQDLRRIVECQKTLSS
ncbi:hypothetical protein AAVH_15399 [Aphelenchoides avenae]|nr:hypothetical protein AAVH_15399 [Aphelenchus avenae]